MTITIKFEDGRQLGRRFQARVNAFDERRILAIQGAARRAALEIEAEGRADMASAGNFISARWQGGLHAKVSFESRTDINIRVTHDVRYWKVFEFGARIEGKPMLWIPLPFALDAQGIRARDYPGQLFKVERQGKAPLLMAGGGAGGKAEPKYFGKDHVTIPKKFHLREIAKAVSRRLSAYYREAFVHG
jgi:hypothetical protein